MGIRSPIIRDGRPEERPDLEELQRRASLIWDSDRPHLLAHPDALAFYRRCGFVETGEVSTRFGPGIRMELAL